MGYNISSRSSAVKPLYLVMTSSKNIYLVNLKSEGQKKIFGEVITM